MTALRSITGEQLAQVAAITVLIAASLALVADVWAWIVGRKS
jgi:hypothetical protein